MVNDSLAAVWKGVRTFHAKNFSHHGLEPILGVGCTSEPTYCFVFINPTARNISTNPSWKGSRYPFIGTKQVWRIFHRADLISDDIMTHIEQRPWTPAFAERLSHS